MTRFQIRTGVVYLVLTALTLSLILLIGRSLQWRYQHDSAVMLYFSYAIDHFGLVPYRDLFDFNGPGAYLFYITLGRLTNYSDPGFHAADIAYLAAISAVTWLLLSRFNRSAAWMGVIGFSLAYLVQGPMFSFEREYIMILPIALATLLSLRPDARYRLKAFLVGLLFSATATIKPHVALGFPCILLFIIYEASCNRQQARRTLPVMVAGIAGASLVGVAIPAAAAGYYLAIHNALPELLDVARNYAPLYSKVGFDRTIIENPLSYYLHHLTNISDNPLIYPWILPAALGSAVVLTSPHRLHSDGEEKERRTGGVVESPSRRLTRPRAQIILLVALASVYFFYPAFQGQFFSYHYLIALYFLTLLSALTLAPLRDAGNSIAEKGLDSLSFYLPPIAAVAMLIVVLPFWGIYDLIVTPQPAPKNGVPDTIAEYLKVHLQPGDTVLSSDWTGGGLHAMLMAGARPANKYFYDYFLYMFVSTPYIQQLRQDYLTEMIAASPRYVIQILGSARPFVTGPDTAQSFPAFQAILDKSYKVVDAGPDFTLYERVPAALSAASP